MVMRQVAKSLLRRTCDDVQDVQQDDHLISHKMTAERDRSSKAYSTLVTLAVLSEYGSGHFEVSEQAEE